MSTTTEAEFLGEDTPDESVAAPVVPDPQEDQQEHEHEYTKDGELSPMCAGGGCVHRNP